MASVLSVLGKSYGETRNKPFKNSAGCLPWLQGVIGHLGANTSECMEMLKRLICGALIGMTLCDMILRGLFDKVHFSTGVFYLHCGILKPRNDRSSLQ